MSGHEKIVAPVRQSESVSVVICTWNRADTLRTTLLSLAGQKGIAPDEVEVLVVDNNSTDHTRAVVEDLMHCWPLGVLRYVFEGKQGKQFALNTAVRLAEFPVLAFTDDDILFPSDWLQRVTETFSDPGVDLAGGKTIVDWSSTSRPDWYRDDMRAVLAGVDVGDERLDPAPKTLAPAGSNLIVRKSTFERFGLYSETHFRHMDHEFGIRCQIQGARMVYEPLIVVFAPVDERCLYQRYFIRWAFKAGISQSGGIHAVGHSPQVPPWTYRRLIQDWLRLIYDRKMNSQDRFALRMQVARDYGAIANAWHAWLRPKAHAAWVQNCSQKKEGLY